jgi:hypothetical protein
MLYDYNQDGTYETMPVNSSGVSAETSYDPNDYWSYVAPFVGEEIIYEPSNYMGTGPTEAATVDQGFIRQPLQSGTWVSADWVSQESKWRGSFEAGGVHTFAADGKAAFYQGTCPPTCKEKVTGS